MIRERWHRRMLALCVAGSVLLGLQCPPLVTSSFKTGLSNWLVGSVQNVNVTQISDFISGVFSGVSNTNNQ